MRKEEKNMRKGALGAGIAGLVSGLILFGVAAVVGSGDGYVASLAVGIVVFLAGITGTAYGARAKPAAG